jgi:hypothetical protein
MNRTKSIDALAGGCGKTTLWYVFKLAWDHPTKGSFPSQRRNYQKPLGFKRACHRKR